MFKEKLVDHYINKSIELSNNYLNKQAINKINKILIFTNNIEALSFKGLYYSYLFEKEKCYECFDKIFKYNPQSIIGYYRKGLANMQLNEYEHAITYFKEILCIDSNHILTLNFIGICYQNLKKYDLALEYFNEILKKNPNDINTLINLGSCYNDLEQYNDSIFCLNKCLNINSNETRAMLEISHVYHDKENYSNALKYINRALKINPNDITLKLSKYLFLAKFNKFELSLQGFEEISKIYFDDWQLINLYYNYYSSALKTMKKYNEALNLYNEYLEKYPNFPNEDILYEKEELLKLINEKK